MNCEKFHNKHKKNHILKVGRQDRRPSKHAIDQFNDKLQPELFI